MKRFVLFIINSRVMTALTTSKKFFRIAIEKLVSDLCLGAQYYPTLNLISKNKKFYLEG